MIVTTFETGQTRAFADMAREFTMASRVSRHPVLGSSATTDHVEPQPIGINVEIVEPDMRYGTSFAGRPVTPPRSGSYLYDAYAYLESIRSNRLILEFGDLPVFLFYVLEAAVLRRNKRQQWTISCSFVEFVEATASTTRVPGGNTTATGGPDRQSIGQQAPKPARDGLAIGWLKSIGAVD